jgi:hypothetical protein
MSTLKSVPVIAKEVVALPAAPAAVWVKVTLFNLVLLPFIVAPVFALMVILLSAIINSYLL